MQFNCDEVVSLIQKLCENIGAMDLQHDKASVTWIGTFLQMRAKELEDKVAELWLGHLGPGAVQCPQARETSKGSALLSEKGSPNPCLFGGESRVLEWERNMLKVAQLVSAQWTRGPWLALLECMASHTENLIDPGRG